MRIVSSSWIGAGFFAELRQVVYNLIYHCKNDKIPKLLVVDWSQEFFPYKEAPTANGWDLYFEPIHSEKVYAYINSKKCPSEPKHDKPYCIERWLHYKEYLRYRQFIHDRFFEYITIKQDILEKVDRIYNEHMKDHFCIGMHVRFAQAHVPENPYGVSLSLQDYIREAQLQFASYEHRNPKIFLATDSQYVIDEFKKHFDALQLVFTNAFRAKYKEDPHLIYEYGKYYTAHPNEFHEKKPGYFGGLMTLIDCLLLAKCQMMIHSVSNVAEFATWINPHLESIFMPKGLDSRPCSCTRGLFLP